METPLKPEQIGEFLSRFENFNDSLLHHFSCTPFKRGGEDECALEFEAKDNDVDSGWSRVRIRLEKLKSWRFNVPVDTFAYYLMSNGVHICHDGQTFYVELGEFCDQPESFEEFLSSDFHFAAQQFYWEATEMT